MNSSSKARSHGASPGSQTCPRSNLGCTARWQRPLIILCFEIALTHSGQGNLFGRLRACKLVLGGGPGISVLTHLKWLLTWGLWTRARKS